MTVTLVLAALLGAPSGPRPALRAAPLAITVSTVRGDARVPVRINHGAPVLPAVPLLRALGGGVQRNGEWADVTLASQQLRLLLDAPYYSINGRVEPMAAPAVMVNDSVQLPLQFIAEVLPRLFAERYRYDEEAARLTELGPAVASARPAPPRRPGERGGSTAVRLPNGLRRGHVVTIDPGHGGVDPGNPGLFFPGGVKEKNVTLQVGLLLREALRARGIGIRMTRTRDTLIALGDRGAYCAQACDLFVSLHVNSLPRRPNYTAARGFETYFLAEAKTEEAARVAQMENEAVRFEAETEQAPTRGLDFILKDLQLNEHLRESALLAGLVQDKLGEVHSGTDRGVKQAGFMVLTTARRPAILVELGYSTNPDDGRLLTQPGSQRRMAGAIADAIVAYLLDYERRAGVGVDSGATP